MSDSPVIHADIGDGKRRRFFLGSDELAQIKREAGRGFYTIYTQFTQNAEPHEVKAILRLALIGGGETPKDAGEVVDYYCAPPRPLRDCYMIAFECLSAVWNGYESKKGGQSATVAEMDSYFTDLEAAFAKGGLDVTALRGKSFAEIQDLLAAMRGEADAAAPDADTFNAIKAASKAKKATK